MKAIQNGLKKELEAIAEAKGIDISKADRMSGRGSAVPPMAQVIHITGSGMQDVIRRSICSPER